jgi:hypothetical protein
VDYVDEEYDDEYDEERNNEKNQLENDEMNPNEILEMTRYKQNNNNNDDDNDGDNNYDKELFEEESNPEESGPEESETELESEEVDEVTRTKSGRIIKPSSKLNLHPCHLQTQSYERTGYSIEIGKVIAKNILRFNHKCNYQFVETYGLKKGLK